MRVRLGIIGCGDICRKAYLPGCAQYASLEIVAFADARMEAAREVAAAHGKARALSVDELLTDPAVELVVNLTTPEAHAPLNRRALEHGKHVYCEKPFCITHAEGRAVLDLAARKNLLVGGAPDTFLGDALQTCRKLLDDGAIGEPKSGVAFMLCRGHEHWHPNPEFYYAPGGGPLFDMGPYYLTALVHLLGPARRVTAMANSASAERLISSQPKSGQRIQVRTPTYLSGVVEFANGALITTIFSFDNYGHHLPEIEIYGTDGSLFAPDPNRHSGTVAYRHRELGEKKPAPSHRHGGTRGIGIADMAAAVRQPARGFRATGELAYHVFDVMQSFFDSVESGRTVAIASTCAQPAPLPVDLPPGTTD